MKIQFNFSPLRYLAQKFPILSNPTADKHSDPDRRDAIFRWPSDKPAWEKVEEEARVRVLRLRQSNPPEVERGELSGNATVADAIERLNEWFIAEARKMLPESVVGLLKRELGEQWAHFSTDPLPEDYLWSYLSLLGDCGLDRSGLRCTIPPLVGRVEAAAYTIWDGGEDGEQIHWLNGGRFVHLCDRLDDVFCENRLLEGDDGKGVLGDDGRPKREKRLIEDARLWIDYRSAGLTRDWVERQNNFPYWPGAMQATEHWILRMKEVDQPRAERTVSVMLREPLAHSIKSKLPRVWQTIQHAARNCSQSW